MKSVVLLKEEINEKGPGSWRPDYYRALGYSSTCHGDNTRQRADAIYDLFARPIPHIFKNDFIVGSIHDMMLDSDRETGCWASEICGRYPERTFKTNADHYAPDYATVLREGLPGMFRRIESSKKVHAKEEGRLHFLEAMETALSGLKARLLRYADRCMELCGDREYDEGRLMWIASNCRQAAQGVPETFAQALQLVWMIHTCFVCEGRYAMALGRIDQYLYPFFRHDLDKGILTPESAVELLENAFIKIYEYRVCKGYDDVVNICIGGCGPDGSSDVNELSYLVLEAVKNCATPGPNLSARITPDTPDDFLDACLRVIGTGIGYPALMNDQVNIEALRRYGCYEEEDIYNYSMVGCIENFITGKQPPWSDGRFDTPRFFEYLFNRGVSYDGKSRGLDTGSVSDISSMADLMGKFEKQIVEGVRSYMEAFRARNCPEHPEELTMPFLSCFCDGCIEKGLDINMGGSKYPSAHGAAVMGIGTVCDSLAAVEKVVFADKATTLEELRDAMIADFKGYDRLRELLLAAPKYGNNDDFVDKYAIWYVSFLAEEFRKYHTPDGGCVYIAMAANTNNISAGRSIGATPDGRLAKAPLSDAASPTYGRDANGPTAVVLSVTKPDYGQVACGTVLNQKFSPGMFADGKREKLAALIRVYFARGGQEIQMNATSREALQDAMVHPDRYSDLVVRVSGFSAYYVTLERAVQEDILNRTQQE